MRNPDVVRDVQCTCATPRCKISGVGVAMRARAISDAMRQCGCEKPSARGVLFACERSYSVGSVVEHVNLYFVCWRFRVSIFEVSERQGEEESHVAGSLMSFQSILISLIWVDGMGTVRHAASVSKRCQYICVVVVWSEVMSGREV